MERYIIGDRVPARPCFASNIGRCPGGRMDQEFELSLKKCQVCTKLHFPPYFLSVDRSRSPELVSYRIETEGVSCRTHGSEKIT